MCLDQNSWRDFTSTGSVPRLHIQRYQLNRSAQYFRNLANQITYAIDAVSKKPADVKFLDFSMGWGNWMTIAKAFGCDVYGSEFSPARIKHAEKLGIKVLNPEEIRGMKFDVINIEQVLEHLVNPCDVLKELKQSLNKRGVIRAGVPRCANLKYRLSIANWGSTIHGENSLNDIAPLQHINFFSGESLLTSGRMAGLEIFSEKNAHQAGIIKRNLRNVKQWLGNVFLNGQEEQLNVDRAFFCHANE